MSAEVRDVADSPPPDALAPTSSHGCGDDGCEPCYGNEAWQRWNAERQGICPGCGEDWTDDPDLWLHDADEECPYVGGAP